MISSVQDQLRLEQENKKEVCCYCIFSLWFLRSIFSILLMLSTITYTEKHYSLLCQLLRFVDLHTKLWCCSCEEYPGTHCPFSSDQPGTTVSLYSDFSIMSLLRYGQLTYLHFLLIWI